PWRRRWGWSRTSSSWSGPSTIPPCAVRTSPGPGSSWAGSPRSPWKKAWSGPWPGSAGPCRPSLASRPVGEVPAVGLLEALPQSDPRFPPEGGQPAHVQELPRHSVGHRRVEAEIPLEPDHVADELRQLADGDVLADP